MALRTHLSSLIVNLGSAHGRKVATALPLDIALRALGDELGLSARALHFGGEALTVALGGSVIQPLDRAARPTVDRGAIEQVMSYLGELEEFPETADAESLNRACVERARSVFNADRCVLVIDSGSGRQMYVSERGDERSRAGTPGEFSTGVERAVRGAEGWLVLEDSLSDCALGERRSVKARRPATLLAASVGQRSSVRGLICVERERRSAPYTEAEGAALRLLASALGRVLHCAALGSRMQDLERELKECSARLSEDAELRAAGLELHESIHDLAGIVSAIAGEADLALEDAALPAAIEALRRIRELSGLARQSIRDRQGSLRSVNDERAASCSVMDAINTAVQMVESSARGALSAGPRLEVRHECRASVQMARSTLVETIYVLIRNAIEASSAGGRVLVVSSMAKDSCFIDVADEGQGMSRDVMRRAGMRITTSKGDAGNGLGLLSAIRRVRASGGELTISSAPGVGTRVRIALRASESVKRTDDWPA